MEERLKKIEVMLTVLLDDKGLLDVADAMSKSIGGGGIKKPPKQD